MLLSFLLLTGCAATVVVYEPPVSPTPAWEVGESTTPPRSGQVAWAEKGELEPITLLLGTDLHYISPRLTDNGEYFTRIVENGDGKFMAYSEEIVEAFVDQVIAQAPDGLLLAGDITFNGARLSHEDLAKKLARVEEAGIPVYLIPGNHDIDSRQAASFSGDTAERVESVTAGEFGEIYYDFGFDEALSYDNVSLSYTAQLAPNLRLLAVDANGISLAPGIVTDRTVDWVEEQLISAAEDGCYVLAVSHQSLLVQNPMLISGYQMANWERLLALYETYGVIGNLSGHLHVQHIAVSEGGVADISTSALATSPNQYGVITLEGRGGSYHTESVRVPQVEDFAQLSRDFLWRNAYRQAERRFPDPEDDALRRFNADVNVAYLAGRPDTIDWDGAPAGAQEDAFLSAYFLSIREDREDHTVYTFSFGEEEGT